MRAEIISVGTELLLGQIVDTNASYLARTLAALGIDLYTKTTVGDNANRLAEALRLALSHADLIITSGGLGPTEDDLTKEVVAEVFGEKLVPHPDSERAITDFFTARGVTMVAANLKQALIYESGQAIPNAMGTAPGVILEKNGKIVISLPGPPAELVPMVESFVVPFLRSRVGGGAVILSRSLRIVGLGESAMEEKIKSLLQSTNPTVAPLAHPGECHLRITAKADSQEAAEKMIGEIESKILAILGDVVYGVDCQTLEEVVVDLLLAREMTVSLAESCTGGLVAHRLTDIPRVSATLQCGLVTYSDRSKCSLLSVPDEMIQEHGAVSEEVAKAMAEGARLCGDTDIGVGITGIAGPGGGSAKKPIGLVYIALSHAKGSVCREFRFGGSRKDVKWRASQMALDMIRRHVLGS